MSTYENIFEAAQKGSVDAVKILLSNGANINAKTISGYTPLHLAAGSGGSIELVENNVRWTDKYNRWA